MFYNVLVVVESEWFFLCISINWCLIIGVMCCIISGLFLGNGSVSVGRILMLMFVVIIGNSVVGCLIFCIIFV